MESSVAIPITELSLNQLLAPEVLANPYPLYRRLRTEDPVHWDPYLQAWVMTRYSDVAEVLAQGQFSAVRTPSPHKLAVLGMGRLAPIAEIMVQQMLFLDPPQHTRLRSLFAGAFTARRVASLRSHIADVADKLLDRVGDRAEMDIIADFADPLPAIVTAGILGFPATDYVLLKKWSESFGEMLGNFQHNPGRSERLLESIQEMLAYFRDAVQRQIQSGENDLINSLVSSRVDGDQLTEDEIVANLILTMVGGLETTTNLISNGLLALLRNPEQMWSLQKDTTLISAAVEELLRYDSPSQHTARIAAEDMDFHGQEIRRGQAMIAVIGAANRDPAAFRDPDHLDLGRTSNRHLAFGWAAHFCFGASLARMEGQAAFLALLRRFPSMRLKAAPITWRPNLGLRGPSALHVTLQE